MRQKDPIRNRQTTETPYTKEQIPDLIDLLNDMFFESVNTDMKTYNLTGIGRVLDDRNEDDFDLMLTHEWLEEAKQMVALSPSRDYDSPSRLVVSPRFATTQGSLSTSSLDKRDYMSARR
ncbi:uncharacterized protein Fot_29588 [Forsythia ovata]|uniref:Uncharacterized protein n=1 Tax=Forsythia ovata TaxID=205694 RepID=A0ABD1TSA8_9LAMI